MKEKLLKDIPNNQLTLKTQKYDTILIVSFTALSDQIF
jgi:hypothetical protein